MNSAEPLHPQLNQQQHLKTAQQSKLLHLLPTHSICVSSLPFSQQPLIQRYEITPAPSPVPSPILPSSSYIPGYQLPRSISPQLPPLRLHLSQSLSMDSHRYRDSHQRTPLLESSSSPLFCSVSLPPLSPANPVSLQLPAQTRAAPIPTQFLFLQSHESPHTLHQPKQLFQQQDTVNKESPAAAPSSEQLLASSSPRQPTLPRKRGRKSKQDLLLNQVGLTSDQKKINHMHAEQRRRALVRSSLHQLSLLVPGMKPPIEGDGANAAAGNTDGSSRVEILEGSREFIQQLLKRNALLKAKLELKSTNAEMV
ncbi:hypothetical protein BJ741DRAFT_598570 [Chytriomyces cf. hyalinus JEL632]|nr:hypothetical protein BJ741DRAFT_598570 [Chytriomyces cf. hyalinus JEL632]